ncbi:MAG: DUF2971 domain-containing protein [Alishewanella aestuarii]
MDTLFKYMPLRPEFFEDPLFRLTQPNKLNDPFDSKPTREAIRKKIAFLTDTEGEGAGYVSDETIDSKHSFWRDELSNKLNEFGVISLTENVNNLLMWSHYANEHNGIVVELVNDDDVFMFSDRGIKDSRVGSKRALRVRYDSKRPGVNIPDNCIYSYYEDEFYRHVALTKSDDWMYEKEHRFLIPANEADVAVLRLNRSKQINLDEFEKYLHFRKITFSRGEEHYRFENTGLNQFITNTDMVRLDPQINAYGEVMLFKRAKPQAIKAIYFGCRVPKDIIESVITQCRQNMRFSTCLSFYQAVESRDRFEVDFAYVR